ncbi:MAG: ATP-dependent DNA helicase RecG, partial [Polymorphobacter sp.]
MRPETLNPLFAETGALLGVGSAQARQLARLGLTRAVDLLFHLPVMALERLDIDALDAMYVDRLVTIELEVLSYQSGGPRAPLRVRCRDTANTWIDLVYFGQGGGYARKLLPIGETRLVSGKLDRYGQGLQIAHPDFVLRVTERSQIPSREPVYGLTEGITNRRMGVLAQAVLARTPELDEWIESSVLAQHDWPGWRDALAQSHRLEDAALVHDRLAYDELLANQLALLLVR